MKKSNKIQLILTVFVLFLCVLSFTVLRDCEWFRFVTTITFIIVQAVDWAIFNIYEKIKNVNVEEIEQLIKNGQKKEAINQIRTNNKCSLLSAMFFVGDLEEKNKPKSI